MKILPFISALPPQQQAASLKSAVASGRVTPAEAKQIAEALRFPAWETFAHATVGSFSYGTTEQVNVTKTKQLPATSPLFARHTKMLIVEPQAKSNIEAKYFAPFNVDEPSRWREQDVVIEGRPGSQELVNAFLKNAEEEKEG